VQITPTVNGSSAEIRVESKVNGGGSVEVAILDAEGREVLTGSGMDTTLTLDRPHLWDGVRDPATCTPALSA